MAPASRRCALGRTGSCRRPERVFGKATPRSSTPAPARSGEDSSTTATWDFTPRELANCSRTHTRDAGWNSAVRTHQVEARVDAQSLILRRPSGVSVVESFRLRSKRKPAEQLAGD